MGSTPQQPATGPAIMEQLVQLRKEFDTLAEEARAHWSKEEQRLELTDKFIDPAMDLQGLLKQVFGMLRDNHRAVQRMEREVRQLATAVELAMSTDALELQQQVVEH